MRFKCFIITAFFAASLLSHQVSAQSYSYRSFDESTGLLGNYVSTISQDNKGLLWIGLESGLFLHDGFDFFKVDFPDTVSKGYPCTTFCDKSGKMWVGSSDGVLFVSDNSKPLTRIKELTADKINRIRPGFNDNVWVVTQSNGLYLFDNGKDNKFINITVPEGNAMDILCISSDTLLLAAQDNLYLCSYSQDRMKIIYTFPELNYQWVSSLEKLSPYVWAAGTDGMGLFIIKRNSTGFSVTNINGSPSLNNVRITDLLKGDGNKILIATRESGVVKAEFSSDFSAIISEQSYNEASGLTENDVKTIFRDREDNLWIGLFNSGLQAVTTNAFSFYKPETNKEIRFIGEQGSKIIMGNRSQLYEFNVQSGEFKNFKDLSGKLKGASIVCWHSTPDGIQWIGTDGEGVFRITPDGSVKSFFKAVNPGQDKINSIDSDSKYLWLATVDGVVIIDRITGKVVEEYSTMEMLPHNKILQVKVKEEGVAAVATESESPCYIDITKGSNGVYTGDQTMSGYMKNIVQAVSFSGSDSSVSLATVGNGLFRLRGDSLYNVTTQEGLLSNYVYSVLLASDGRIWSGHEKGFSVWDPEAGTIRTFSRAFGVTGECLPNALFESFDGHIFIGTTDGLWVYNPVLERKNTSAPQTSIISVVIDGVEHPWQDSYLLPYKKIHDIVINYAGINLSDPLNVVYKTKMENWDEAMSASSGERKRLFQLPYGHYHFVVESASVSSLNQTSQASFDLVIRKPVYRTWWFRLLALLVAALAVFIIIKMRDRAHRKLNEFLEEELTKRTREVHEQQEELIQKNQDITESIKYAKRIQSSVLPDTARLSTVFNEAFVFFAPRDIVSGDFYWFDWIDKDRFILVCADSTGHGVPGAFMSMIGTALLQDIITRKKIVKPSAILRELDKQVFATLNQNQEVEAANDGMDIVVCEFNINDHHVTFASAMRPVILIIDGEQHYVRGNRSSIGGDSASEKFFDDQEYYLKKGDIVYLFSDGYPDQFGGPCNKKMKISRLRSLIDEVKNDPLDVQHTRLRDYFYEWKSDFDQVDDVMIMGIKV